MILQQNRRVLLNGNKKAIFFISLFILLTNVAFAHQRANTAFTPLRRLLRQMPAFRADFTQITTSILQSNTKTNTGTLLFSQPSYMRWQYKTPSSLTLVIGEKTIWLVNPALKNVTLYSKARVFQDSSFLPLQKNLDFNAVYTIVKPKKIFLQTNTKDQYLYFKPKGISQKKQLIKEIQMRFNLAQKAIKEIIVLKTNNTYKHFIFSHFKIIKKVSKSKFIFTPTTNMDIIDSR